MGLDNYFISVYFFIIKMSNTPFQIFSNIGQYKGFSKDISPKTNGAEEYRIIFKIVYQLTDMNLLESFTRYID